MTSYHTGPCLSQKEGRGSNILLNFIRYRAPPPTLAVFTMCCRVLAVKLVVHERTSIVKYWWCLSPEQQHPHPHHRSPSRSWIERTQRVNRNEQALMIEIVYR